MRHRRTEPAAAAPVVAQPSSRVVPPLEGVRLPPFSGDRYPCIKCSYGYAKTIYLPGGKVCTHCVADGYRPVWGLERLHRVCARCGFSWDEACVEPVRTSVTLIMPAVSPMTKLMPACQE